jgi:hypothetical protein
MILPFGFLVRQRSPFALETAAPSPSGKKVVLQTINAMQDFWSAQFTQNRRAQPRGQNMVDCVLRSAFHDDHPTRNHIGGPTTLLGCLDVACTLIRPANMGRADCRRVYDFG